LGSSDLSDTPQNGKVTIKIMDETKKTQKPKIVISPNITKISDTIDKNGKIISHRVSNSSIEELKQLQEIRAKKLGLK